MPLAVAPHANLCGRYVPCRRSAGDAENARPVYVQSATLCVGKVRRCAKDLYSSCRNNAKPQQLHIVLL